MKYCPVCNKEYEDTANFCKDGHGKLEVKAVETGVTCPNCGAENPANSKFCNECGAKITAITYKCSKCGKEYDNAVKFCNECGGKINSNSREAINNHPINSALPKDFDPWELVYSENFEKNLNFDYYEDLANKGDEKAQFVIGFCYMWGCGCNKNDNTAVSYLEKAASAFPKAYYVCGWIYEDQNEYDKAIEYYKKAIGSSYLEAYKDLGGLYFYKNQIKNIKEAKKYYKKGIEADVVSCYYGLGNIYDFEYEDEETASEWYKKGAEHGDLNCQKEIAKRYLSGNGIYQSDEKSFYWYQEALKNKKLEDPSSFSDKSNILTELGKMYLFGNSYVQEDDKIAFSYFKKANKCENVDLEAPIKLGDCYYHGWGCSQNYYKAFQWYKKACEEEYALDEAKFKLGFCYWNGEGCEQDFESAVDWWWKCKSEDSDYMPAEANFALGLAYYFGRGVETDQEFGINLIKEASDQGFDEASEWLEENGYDN